MPIVFHAGLEGPFYGCDGLFFKIGETVYRCEEDSSDGYRSYMGDPEIWEGEWWQSSEQWIPRLDSAPLFFRAPLDTVWVCPDSEEGAFDGWRLISTTSGRTWLRFGTDRNDSYYPYAVWEYTPLHDPNKEVH